MRWMRTLAAVAGLVCLSVVALGLWALPRADVADPTAADPPAQVVQRYVAALDARDFATVRRICPRDADTVGMNWYSPRSPRFRDLQVRQVGPVRDGAHSGSQLAADGHWDQAVAVSSVATLDNFDGTGEQQPHQPWTFYLVRHDDSHAWQVIDQGMV